MRPGLSSPRRTRSGWPISPRESATTTWPRGTAPPSALKPHSSTCKVNVATRRKEKAATASIRIELHALTKALKLAKLGGWAAQIYEFIPPNDPSTVRKGFVTRDALQTLLKHLPEHLRSLVEFAFFTGWRKREMTGLKWAAVDREAHEIRLRAEETKTATARVLPYGSHAGLVAIIEGQWAKAETLLRERGRFPEFVFTKPDGGELRNFKRSWRTACKEAGKPGLLLHDMRRSAARNLLHAGVPQVVAMAITGHKTISIFQRYAIVAPSDVGEALGRVAEKEEI